MRLEQRAVLAPYLREGRVDYAALERGLDLAPLLGEIAQAEVEGTSREEQLAFYLNAYNLLTLQQVLHCLQRDPQWPGPVSIAAKLRFFVLSRHRVAGRRLSLMALENRVIRRRFADPRVHFALNCASTSCPHLPGQLFVATTLEQDLEQLTEAFLNSPEVHYDPVHKRLTLSPIFRWYRRDFRPSVQAFIARYRDVPLEARLAYRPYDWRLNRQ
jgi:hypothetical protein